MAADYGTRRLPPLADKVLCLTHDVARILGVTRWGVQWLETTGQLARAFPTVSGERVFWLQDVYALATERARQRARQRHPRLAVIPLRMARAQGRLPFTRRKEYSTGGE